MESNSEKMETPQITEAQKINLFEEAIALLEDKFMALCGDAEVNRIAVKGIFESNVGSLIEEICAGNPDDGVGMCQAFFAELAQLFEWKDPSTLDQKGKDTLYWTFAHKINLKLAPLMLKKMKKTNDSNVKEFIEFFESDKKRFMKNGIGTFFTVTEEYKPEWYKTLDARRRVDKARADAVHDPKTAKLLKDIRDKAMRKLRGE